MSVRSVFFKSIWWLSSGDVCAHDKSDRERGLGLLAVSLASLWHMAKQLPPRQDGTRRNLGFEPIVVPHPCSLLATVLIALESKCVRQSLLASGRSFLKEQNRKII